MAAMSETLRGATETLHDLSAEYRALRAHVDTLRRELEGLEDALYRKDADVRAARRRLVSLVEGEDFPENWDDWKGLDEEGDD